MALPANQTTSNSVHIHNFLQLGPESRGSTDHKIQSAHLKEYTEHIKLQTCLNNLELYLKRNVSPKQWTTNTIMLLNHKLIEQIGNLSDYTKDVIGFENLKSALIRTQNQALNNLPYLDEITTRVQRDNESASIRPSAQHTSQGHDQL